MKKKVLIIVITVIVFVLIALGLVYLTDMNRMDNNRPVLFSTWGRKYTNPIYEEKEVNTKLDIVLSLEDNISENSTWCGTFNLIWNDLKNNLAKQDIIFASQSEIVENLNRETFNEKYLSEDSYYKVYGIPSLDLKTEIEEQIKKKFNETSDILDDFDWSETDYERYFLYAMLKKEFEFPNEFTELNDGSFRNYNQVKYFGIDKTTDEKVKKQVEVLYYNSEDDFAIKLLTKNNDEIIIAKGTNGTTFKSIYEETIKRGENYTQSKYLQEMDTLKIPNIDFNLKEEIKEVENNPFLFSNGHEYEIEKAMQTIQFELNKKGGKIKSEAGMMVKDAAAVIDEKPRKFEVDDTFVIFLKETGKDLPYFAAKISDIANVQKDVQPILDKEEDISYFYGKVIESHQTYVIVEPNEDEKIRKSADEIYINLGEDNDMIYAEGTNLKIKYKGYVMETYPAQVDVVSVELKF